MWSAPPTAPAVTPLTTVLPRPTPNRAARPDDAPEEDEPDEPAVNGGPSATWPLAGMARSPEYAPRSRLTRQTPQTVIIVGIAAILAVCVLSVVFVSVGQDVAAGFLIICGAPFALFVLGTGVVLLLTGGRSDKIRR